LTDREEPIATIAFTLPMILCRECELPHISFRGNLYRNSERLRSQSTPTAWSSGRTWQL